VTHRSTGLCRLGKDGTRCSRTSRKACQSAPRLRHSHQGRPSARRSARRPALRRAVRALVSPLSRDSFSLPSADTCASGPRPTECGAQSSSGAGAAPDSTAGAGALSRGFQQNAGDWTDAAGEAWSSSRWTLLCADDAGCAARGQMPGALNT